MKKVILLINFLCVIGYSQPEYTYVQVDPPIQPTATGVSFYAINDSGVVAARAYGNQTQRWHILRWSEDGGYSVAYNAPTTDVSVDPTSINNLGTITAIRSENIGIIILSNGSTFTLPFTSGQGSYAYDSNILDQVVGRSLGSAVLWENGNINNITPGTAFAINDLEDIALIVPESIDGGGGLQTVLRYANGTSTILNFPVEYGVPYSLNNNREIVGYYTDKAFYWSAQTGVVDLPGLPGFTFAAAVAINDSGIIVGYVVNPGYLSRAVVWYKNDFGVYLIKDINDYVPVGFGEARWAEDINNAGVIVGTIQTGSGARGYLLNPPEFFEVTRPVAYDKWIAGETDTIKWTGGQAGQLLQIEFSNDNGSSYQIIDFGIDADSGYYTWALPDNILTTKAKIKLTDMVSPAIKSESGTFRIKPYLLTRLNADSTYYEYRKNRDQFNVVNDSTQMWPESWWQQFDYQGIDPFTNSQYSQWQGDSVFFKIAPTPNAHMDWISWVNTFSVDACYWSTVFNVYKKSALLKWWSKLTVWNGSCFGIATANALVFADSQGFRTKYPEFPEFVTPISVTSNNTVRKIFNELFTYQFGNPHRAYINANWSTLTPNQTLDNIKELFREDNTDAATLSFWNNNGNGGHNILPYALKKDTINPINYLLYVYDNSLPNSNNPITFNTTANAGNGSWNTPDWINQPGGLPWGGFGKIILLDPATNYLGNPIMPKQNAALSPFILDNSELQIFSRIGIDIQISNQLNEQIGHINGALIDNLPGAVPQYILNGSETPPIGYNLQTTDYSVLLSNFEEENVETFFFTGNKSFMYERSGAIQTQTDRLFFDGGVSVTNPDAQTKTVKLLNLINETTQEKLTVIRQLELTQNDSVKIENPDSNKVKLISYGSAKDYDIELNYVTENGIGRFGDFDIPLTANTSHTFVPDWSDITNTDLMVLVDNGNNGTIDDTLYLQNQVTGIDNDQGSLLSPNSYNLAQNFPNPFNPSTTISWQSPVGSHQTLKIYDILGNEVATLVDEFREAGSYAVEFDASQLASGIYLYKLQAGSFVQTRKMILLR